jgi:hypothetical protein
VETPGRVADRESGVRTERVGAERREVASGAEERGCIGCGESERKEESEPRRDGTGYVERGFEAFIYVVH